MKTLTWLLPLAAVMLAAGACAPKAASPKVLILYYSQTSNTRTVAEAIQTKLDADIEEIIPVTPYGGSFEETIARCMEEREKGILPEVQPITSDLSKYDVIFLGYPVWFGTFAPPVASLLEQIDLSGKKVVPFCTFGSGGLQSSAAELALKEPDAEVLPGYGVRAARIDAVPEEIDQFLKANGFIKGKAIKLEDFSEQKQVTEEEAEIFISAVKDYPMMGDVQASAVASRPIPGGMEYLFTVIPQPREGDPAPDPKMPPMREMKVYVTALEGQTPVFTQVVR